MAYGYSPETHHPSGAPRGGLAKPKRAPRFPADLEKWGEIDLVDAARGAHGTDKMRAAREILLRR